MISPQIQIESFEEYVKTIQEAKKRRENGNWQVKHNEDEKTFSVESDKGVLLSGVFSNSSAMEEIMRMFEDLEILSEEVPLLIEEVKKHRK